VQKGKRKMRDEVYVGALISERGFEHSTGLWKHHTYIKKIGDRYYYTVEQLKNAGSTVKDVASTLKDARENIKESKDIDRAIKTGSSERKPLLETVKDEAYKRSGLKDRDDAKTYAKVAKIQERRANSKDANERANAKKSLDVYRKSEKAAKERYSKSLIGKAENAVGSAKQKRDEAVKKVGDRYNSAKNSVKNAASKVKDKKRELSGGEYKKSRYQKADDRARAYQKWAKHDKEDSDRAASRGDKKAVEWYNSARRNDVEGFKASREIARDYESAYAKSARGRVEIAAKKVSNKINHRKRIGRDAARSYEKYHKLTMDAHNGRADDKLYSGYARSGKNPYKDSGHPHLTADERRKWGRMGLAGREQAKEAEKQATVQRRLQYARQSEYERTSLKGRTARAKKRVAKALKRIRRKR
jgi:hypothetical protein